MKRAVAVSLILLTGCQWMPGSEASRIKEAQDVVVRELRDPGSAQFRDVREITLDNGSRAYCGAVNAKNSFGAYAGYRDFVLHRGTEVIIQPGPMEPGDYQSVISNMDFVALKLQICASKQANRSERLE